MKRIIILSLVSLVLSSCSLFEKDKPFDVNGEWSDAFAVSAIIGKCCDIDLTLFDDGGNVTANGRILTPASVRGQYYIYAVTGSGTFDGENLSLSLQSGINTATLTAHLVEDQWYEMEAEFIGFGHRVSNFGFYKED